MCDFWWCDKSYYWLFDRKFASRLNVSLILVIPPQAFLSELVVERVLVEQLWPWGRPCFLQTLVDWWRQAKIISVGSICLFQDRAASQCLLYECHRNTSQTLWHLFTLWSLWLLSTFSCEDEEGLVRGGIQETPRSTTVLWVAHSVTLDWVFQAELAVVGFFHH